MTTDIDLHQAGILMDQLEKQWAEFDMSDEMKKRRMEAELRRKTYKIEQLEKTPCPFILGRDDITFKTMELIDTQVGRCYKQYLSVARDDEFVYFWEIGPVQWNKFTPDHANPFIKIPIDKDNSNWWCEEDFIYPPEDEWLTLTEFLIDNAFLPDTKYFDFLFDYQKEKTDIKG